MKIALVDDNPQEIEKLSKMLADEFDNSGLAIEQMDFFKSGEDFLHIWKSKMYDMILLDLFMYQLSGVDVAKKIRETDSDVRLVFCTSSNDFASESYLVNASFYLRKPVDKNGICAMIQKNNFKEYELSRYITLPDGQRLILRNMIYSEYFNHIIQIHTKTESNLQIRISQAEFEQCLAEFSFMICCCKGIMVNMYEISKHDNDIFFLKNGSKVPISRRKSKEIEEIYTDFMFEKMRGEITQ